MPVPVDYGQGTLIDGELLVSKTTGRYVFLFFDVMAVRGVPCHSQSFTYERRLRIGQEVQGAFETSAKYLSADQLPVFTVKLKPAVQLANGRQFVAEMQKNLEVDVDGWVLSPNCGGVKFGQHLQMFKLKSQKDSTGDFQFVLLDELKQREPMVLPNPENVNKLTNGNQHFMVPLCLCSDDGRSMIYYTLIPITINMLTQLFQLQNIQQLHGRGVECQYDLKLQVWIPLKLRSDTDRSTPNALHTILSLMDQFQKPTLSLENILPPA
jgi:hypothetical protein